MASHDINTLQLIRKTGIYRLKILSYLEGDKLPTQEEFEKILSVFQMSEDEFWALNVDGFKNTALELGSRLMYFRRKKGLTKVELKKKLLIYNNSINNYERGISYPNSNSLQEILDCLGVSLKEFWATNIENIKPSKRNHLFNKIGSLDQTNQKFITQFVKYKESHRLTSGALARMLDVDPQKIIDMENGLIEPKPKLFRDLLKIFNVLEDNFYNEDPIVLEKVAPIYDALLQDKDLFFSIMTYIRCEKGLSLKAFDQLFKDTNFKKYNIKKQLPPYLLFTQILAILKMQANEFYALAQYRHYFDHIDDIGLRIKNYRLKCGLSKNLFSRKMGFFPFTLSNVENGLKYPTEIFMYKMIKAYDIDLFEFRNEEINLIKQRLS